MGGGWIKDWAAIVKKGRRGESHTGEFGDGYHRDHGGRSGRLAPAMSVGAKISAALVSTLLLLWVLTGRLILQEDQRLLDSQADRHGEALLNLIAALVMEPLVAADYGRLESLLGDIGKGTAEIRQIEVFRNGAKVAGYWSGSQYGSRECIGLVMAPATDSAPAAAMGQVRLLLARDGRPVLAGEWEQNIWVYLSASFVGTLLVLRWMLGRTLRRRVARLSRSVESIVTQELAAEVPSTQSMGPPAGGDEFDGLEARLAIMHAGLRQRNDQFRARAGGLDVAALDQTAQWGAAKERAESASRAKALFLANMSHEIRAPIHNLLGYAGLLKQTGLDAKQRDYVAAIGQSAEKLREMLDGMLDFSRIESGEIALEQREFDLRELVDFCNLSQMPVAYAKGLELVGGISPGTPRRFIGDGNRIRQVLVNLMGNAVKFTHLGGVYLWVEPLNQPGVPGLRFEVQDTGIGIGDAERERLFQPVVQADSNARRRYGGSGLGLAIAKQWVERMGGQLGCSSQVGQGALFWFELPLRPQCTQRSLEWDRPSLVGHRLHLFEPSVLARRALVANLVSLGFEVAIQQGEALGARPNGGHQGVDLLVLSLVAADDQQSILKLLQGLAPDQTPPLLVLGNMLEFPPWIRELPWGPAVTLAKCSGQDQWLEILSRLLERGRVISGTEATAGPGTAGVRTVGDMAFVAGCKVLVVDDAVLGRIYAQTLLAQMGVQALVVDSGAAALEILTRQPVNLVLMDIQMPEMDGLETTRRLRQLRNQGPRTPVIALTAYADQKELDYFLAQGMDDCITKPMHPDRLWAILARWCGADARRRVG